MTASRIDSPILYQWELNENSTRYDYPRGRPGDEVLQIQFSVLAFINFLAAVGIFILILAILKSQKLRSNAFNLYVLFMAIPDFIGSFLCLLTCAMSAPGSDFYSEAMCGFQSFYLIFAFAGNAWTNVIIFHQVHKLLEYSQNRRRYFPPTKQQVFCHVGMVYTYALIWAALMAFPIQGMPIQTKLYYGFACFPMEQDEASSWFMYLVFLPSILLIPFIFSVYVMGRILVKQMLPIGRKRRELAIFLMRLILLYILGWLPLLVLALTGNFVQLGPWFFWASAVISHFQGLASAVVVYYTSKSIKREMNSILCCNYCKGSLEGQEARRSFTGSISKGVLYDSGSHGVSIPEDHVDPKGQDARRMSCTGSICKGESLDEGSQEISSPEFQVDSEDRRSDSEDLMPDLEAGGEEEVHSA